MSNENKRNIKKPGRVYCAKLIDHRDLPVDAVLALEGLQVRRGADQGHLPKPARLLLPKAGHLLAGADAAADHGLQRVPIVGRRRGLFVSSRASSYPPPIVFYGCILSQETGDGKGEKNTRPFSRTC